LPEAVSPSRTVARRASSSAAGQSPSIAFSWLRCTRHWPRNGPGDGEHDLVEARQGLVRAALLDQHLAHGESSEHLEVGVAQRAPHEQSPRLDDVGQARLDPAEVVLSDELTGAREPGAGACVLATAEQREPVPERDLGGEPPVAPVEGDLVPAFHDLVPAGVVADEIQRDRERLDVAVLQLPGLVGGPERRDTLSPPAVVVRRPPPLEIAFRHPP
jgi:hypothetical protein